MNHYKLMADIRVSAREFWEMKELEEIVEFAQSINQPVF
jgi:hypothetical protein